MARNAVVEPLSSTTVPQLAHALRILGDAGVKRGDLQKIINSVSARRLVALALIGDRVGEAVVAPSLSREVAVNFFVGIYGSERVYKSRDLDEVFNRDTSLRDVIAALVEKLPDRERQVTIYEYGLNGLPALDREELTTVTGLSMVDLVYSILCAKDQISGRDPATL